MNFFKIRIEPIFIFFRPLFLFLAWLEVSNPKNSTTNSVHSCYSYSILKLQGTWLVCDPADIVAWVA